MPDFEVKLPDPPGRAQLEPFATIYADVIVPEASASDWFRNQHHVPDGDLERISGRIEAVLGRSFGHSVHPAIYLHALLVCGYFFSQADEATGPTSESVADQADRASMLVQSLVLHQELNHLYLLLA